MPGEGARTDCPVPARCRRLIVLDNAMVVVAPSSAVSWLYSPRRPQGLAGIFVGSGGLLE